MSKNKIVSNNLTFKANLKILAKTSNKCLSSFDFRIFFS